eukprot:1160182-Pelagomonas_calceolata.AAC.4
MALLGSSGDPYAPKANERVDNDTGSDNDTEPWPCSKVLAILMRQKPMIGLIMSQGVIMTLSHGPAWKFWRSFCNKSR